jgi:tellurite resistance protein
VVFRLPHDAPAAASAEYQAAAVLLHLAAAVAQADGRVDGTEEEHLLTHLQQALDLHKPEQVRLAAHLRWVLVNPVGLGGLKKRLDQLDEGQRRSMAQSLVAVAGADGRIDPAEVRALGKIYALLGFEAARVYADLHDLGLGGEDAGPLTVRAASAERSGFSIPAPPAVGAPGMRLDAQRVRAKLAETAAVGALLRGVFVDDSGSAPVVSSGGPGASDSAHSEFLRTLATRAAWPRDELEAQAARLGILLDGALELINERAFDSCGQPACEGDDPVETSADVLKELIG